MTNEGIKAEILRWPVEDQLQLIQELSRSIRETIEAAAPRFAGLTNDDISRRDRDKWAHETG
ncbi:MAG: hypothetical protein M3176_05810 [Chloroflexota bacterium]|nr:hypothetical protein [Chloroflexota bacterium]MDQ6906329.1 hypothetical protein [Chloroflexota bacterium]